MDLSDFNSLLIATSELVERLDGLELKAKQPSSKTSVDADECLIHVPLTVLEELEAGEGGSSNLNSEERLQFAARPDGGDQCDSSV